MIRALAVAIAAVAVWSGPPTGLSVTVDDGVSATAVGDTLSYQVRVHNGGTAEAIGLRVELTGPSGLALKSTADGARGDGGRLVWTIGVAAGQQTTVSASTKVERIPAGAATMASTACVYQGNETRPLVCATDSDQVTVQTESEPWGGWLWVVGGLLAAAGITAAVLRRRRVPIG